MCTHPSSRFWKICESSLTEKSQSRVDCFQWYSQPSFLGYYVVMTQNKFTTLSIRYRFVVTFSHRADNTHCVISLLFLQIYSKYCLQQSYNRNASVDCIQHARTHISPLFAIACVCWNWFHFVYLLQTRSWWLWTIFFNQLKEKERKNHHHGLFFLFKPSLKTAFWWMLWQVH